MNDVVNQPQGKENEKNVISFCKYKDEVGKSIRDILTEQERQLELTMEVFVKLDTLRQALCGTHINRSKLNIIGAEQSKYASDGLVNILMSSEEELWKEKPLYFLSLFYLICHRVGESQLQAFIIKKRALDEGLSFAETMTVNGY